MAHSDHPERSRPAASGDGEEEPISPDRRRFLTRLSFSMAGLAGVLAGLPFVGILFSPLVRRDRDVWRAVGTLRDFPVGSTHRVALLDPDPVPWAGYAARSGAWLRRESEAEFVAFSIHCTHTGCPVQWEEGTQLFLCPCHGGAFYRDGSVAAGPPPVPLERQPVRIRDGQVEVMTTGMPTP
jgi:menaquinol-cytochrome c reductase iron-sulfur subunit